MRNETGSRVLSITDCTAIASARLKPLGLIERGICPKARLEEITLFFRHKIDVTRNKLLCQIRIIRLGIPRLLL